MRSNFTWIDYSIIAIYICFSIYIGLRSSKKNTDSEDYFLGGRKQHWFPVSISIISAELSAISYMGVPGWIYEKDLSYFMFIFLLPVVIFGIIHLFIPIYRKLKLVSVYEYLEKRFNLYVRAFTALLFILLRVSHMATAIYAPSLVLQEIAGIPLIPSISIIGAAVTLYTLKGGIRAVIWTDFMQFFVLIGGAVLILLFAFAALNWDFGYMWRLAGNHTKMFDFSFDLHKEITVWALAANHLVYFMTNYATDQVVAQRYFTTGSEKETRQAMMSAAYLTIPVVALLMMIGVALTAYYALHPELARSLTRADRIVPHFAVNVLPVGAKGLLIAGIFAATMSVISAGVNSLSAVLLKDFLIRFGITRSESELAHAHWVTLGFGLVITATAFFVNQLGPVVAAFGKLSSFFMGPICAFFILGVISKRANSGGVIIGALAGLIATIWVANFTSISWLWWIVVGFLVSAGVGWGASWLFLKPAKFQVTEYTIRT